MTAPLRKDAAVRFTENGQSRMHYLATPLRDIAPARPQTVHQFESENRRNIRRVAIGSGVDEIRATLAYDGGPDSLLEFIAAGRRGASIEYFPSLSNPSEMYPFVLMDATDPLPDPDFGWDNRYRATARFRRIDGGSLQGLLTQPLFYYRAGNPLPGLTFGRSGTAWYMDEGGIVQSAAANVHRVDWSTGEPVLLLEYAATNDLLDTADVDVGDANWTFAGAAWTTAVGVAAVSGGVGVQYTNDGATGSHGLYQATPNLVGTPIVVSAIVEQGDCAQTAIGLYDNTAAGFVALATYTWSTGAISVTQSPQGTATGARARTLRAVGPNGGKLVRIEVYATASNAGNAGRAYLYPTGTGVNSEVAYVHHMQHEDGTVATSPIVCAGTAVTRNNESFPCDFVRPAQSMTIYARMVEIGGLAASASASLGVIHLGNSAPGDDPRILLFANSGSGYAIAHDNGVDVPVATYSAATPSVGEGFELLGVVNPDGSVTIGQSVESGAEATASDATTATIKPLAGERLYLNSLGSSPSLTSLSAFAEVKIAPGVKTMAEMRAL